MGSTKYQPGHVPDFNAATTSITGAMAIFSALVQGLTEKSPSLPSKRADAGSGNGIPGCG